MKNVYGKNVFIPGASNEIGRVCAEAFAKAGWQKTPTCENRSWFGV